MKKTLHLRPTVPIKGRENVKLWWLYAVNAFREGKKLKLFSFKKAHKYIHLYKRR